jgi:ribosomal protein S27AE
MSNGRRNEINVWSSNTLALVSLSDGDTIRIELEDCPRCGSPTTIAVADGCRLRCAAISIAGTVESPEVEFLPHRCQGGGS